MIDNMGMYQGYNVEGSAEIKVTPEKKNNEKKKYEVLNIIIIINK